MTNVKNTHDRMSISAPAPAHGSFHFSTMAPTSKASDAPADAPPAAASATPAPISSTASASSMESMKYAPSALKATPSTNTVACAPHRPRYASVGLPLPPPAPPQCPFAFPRPLFPGGHVGPFPPSLVSVDVEDPDGGASVQRNASASLMFAKPPGSPIVGSGVRCRPVTGS